MRAFGGTNYCRNSCTTKFRQLHSRRTDTTRSTSNQNMVVWRNIRAQQHIFGRTITARNRTQFDIAPVRVKNKDFARRHFHKLSKGAVKIRAHPDVAHRTKTVRSHTRSNQNSLAQKLLIQAFGDFNYFAAAIGALNKRKWCREVPPTISFLNLCQFAIISYRVGRHRY